MAFTARTVRARTVVERIAVERLAVHNVPVQPHTQAHELRRVVPHGLSALAEVAADQPADVVAVGPAEGTLAHQHIELKARVFEGGCERREHVVGVPVKGRCAW
jgi:hypothetical protein